MDLERAHRIARERGPNPIVYWTVRAVIQPFFRLYFRLRRIGTEHIPAEGPVLLASNHRSFSDPFFLGLCLRRPLRFVAKIELFDKGWKARLLLALGAFPVRRGESDEQAMETARIILEQGGAVGIFPEGTRVRPGPAGRAQARDRQAGARDRRAGRPGRDHRHRGHPQGLADSPAAGTRSLRPATQLSRARRRRRFGAHRQRGDFQDLALRGASVGMARRDRADQDRRRHRSR